MGLQADLFADLREAFDGDLSDAVRPFTYCSVTTGTYSPSTGVSETKKAYITRGIFAGCTKKNTRKVQVEDADYDVIVIADELAAAPKIDDEIVQADLGRFAIADITIDPVAATYIFRVTRQ